MQPRVLALFLSTSSAGRFSRAKPTPLGKVAILLCRKPSIYSHRQSFPAPGEPIPTCRSMSDQLGWRPLFFKGFSTIHPGAAGVLCAHQKLARLIEMVRDLLQSDSRPIVFCRIIPTAHFRTGAERRPTHRTVAGAKLRLSTSFQISATD